MTMFGLGQYKGKYEGKKNNEEKKFKSINYFIYYFKLI